MEIREINENDLTKYENFALEEGFIFNTIEWAKIYEKKIHFFGIFNAKKIIGGFSIYEGKKYGVSYLVNPPFTPNISLFYTAANLNKNKQASLQKSIVTEVVNYISSNKYPLVFISLPPNIINTQPFFWKRYKAIASYTYIIDLSKPLKDVLSLMTPKRKNDITRGYKDQIYCEKVTDMNIVKELILKTFKRKNKKIDILLIDKILFSFANEKNSFSFVSYYNNKPSVAVFCVFTKKCAFYLLGGYDEENMHRGAGPIAIENAIKHSHMLGIEKFDFEGSMIPEVESYFRAFGGDLTPYYRISKAILPLEIVLKTVKRQYF